MTDTDQSVAKIREEVCRRLQELEPLLEEAERLRTVLAVLDSETPIAPNGAATADHHVRADKASIMAYIAAHPGVTAAEIARDTGMKRTVVATTVSRLGRLGEPSPTARAPASRRRAVPARGAIRHTAAA